ECRTNSLRHPSHHTDPGTHEIVLYRGKAVQSITWQVLPLRNGHDRVPGIVDKTEREANFRAEVVIDAPQLLPPMGGFGDHCVVAGTNRRIAAGRRIGQGNQIRVQQGNCIGVEHDLVIGKRGLCQNIISVNTCARTVRPLLTEKNSIRIERANVTKVSTTLGERRYSSIEIWLLISGRSFVAELLGPEKKCLVLLCINIWNEEWPTESKSEIIPAIERRLYGLVKVVPRVQS